MEIDYISGQKNDKIFGMSKYQMEIHKRLDIKLNIIEYDSLMTNLEKRYNSSQSTGYNEPHLEEAANINLREDSKIKNFFVNSGKNIFQHIDRYRYMLIVEKNIEKDNIKHLTSQELAYLLNSIKMDRSIVTCYDLIPWAYENNHSRIWKNNMAGLKKANIIMTISEFSRDEIVKYLNYPKERIYIVSAAVDHDLYQKRRDKSILAKLNLPLDYKYILYVGSETPRQNLKFLLKAFNKLKKKLPNVKLLKIGEPQSYGARKKLLNSINDMGLQNDVIFIGYVLEEELPKWYNASDLLVYPCLYAGFGLPPLEAMACGTPVITSNTSSLPEVVDDAGIMVDPYNVNSMSLNMYEILTNEGLQTDLMRKGIKRAKLFNWDKSARETFEVYDSI
jgi:glycosyltransferase involved in cell wall biosynthesis